MTVVTGLVHDGEVYLGGDRSAISAEGLTIDTITQPKVWTTWRHQDTDTVIVVGACDSFRMLQVLQTVVWPDNPAQLPALPYLITRAVPALRDLMEETGLPGDDDGPNLHGNVMVGLEGQLFTIQGDFAVLEADRGYAAIGAGASFASGALHILGGGKNALPNRALTLAMKAAADHSFAVRGPFDTVTTRKED